MGVQTSTAESSSDTDFAPNVNAMVAEGCDLVIGVGFLLEEATSGAAQENPDVSFALVDSPSRPRPTTLVRFSSTPPRLLTSQATRLQA